MEKKIHFLSKHLLWASVILHIAMFSSATNVINTETPEVLETEMNEYAWSAWSSWSSCSRTCGGGVSMQARECLPRIRSAPLNSSIPPLNETVPPPVITVRVTRQTHGGDCQGIDKRYHECNNFPCPGGEMNSRAEQCAAFDRRPFRGRFYTWVPYIDGNSPCTLNCRPLGQQFYASLSLVADGTPCTKQGFRAICVHGTCKAVGREGVLSTSVSRDLRCGRRLVSGLFSRPRLPLGYSYVTTVPKGACRLNVSEIMPSENYIALKISNSSYIVNGEFAVSAPGTYEAAGARFIYTRSNGLDVILALGPIQHPIDIMILYTQPNPSLKYEYFTESLPGEIETEAVKKADFGDFTPTSAPKHTRRHHNYDAMPRLNVGKSKHLDTNKGFYNTDDNIEENIVGNRKFIWKVVSYTQCTRSCGGGIQLGKYRCVEDNANDREVSPVHCTGSSPPARRRRCGAGPCPPRWRAAAWSSCPMCGPATRTRIVGCVQDHSRGITKISDQKCPAPKPPNTDKCNIPDCNEIKTGEVQISSKRVRPREHVDEFRDGPVYTVSVNETGGDLGPEYSFSATAGWFSTEWSECVGWCVGGGVQSRGVRCADPSGCTPRKALEDSRSCTPKLDCEPLEGEWFTGDWSPCSSSCSGKQVRGVLCIGGTGRHLKDSACRDPKPANERDCGTECPAWYYSDWGQCISNCTGAPTGIQRRSVVCARGDKPVLNDAECGPAPPATRACEPQCVVVSPLTPAPGSIIESRRVPVLETTTTTQRIVTKDRVSKDCEDNLTNCALAVQARLCHYKYYIHNCCHSCNGRM